jgi:hypothetical protein
MAAQPPTNFGLPPIVPVVPDGNAPTMAGNQVMASQPLNNVQALAGQVNLGLGNVQVAAGHPPPSAAAAAPPIHAGGAGAIASPPTVGAAMAAAGLNMMEELWLRHPT